MKLKLLYDDLLPKVDRRNMKARLPKVMIVLIANEKFKIKHLNTLSTSYLEIRIEVVGYFNLKVMIKCISLHMVCAYYIEYNSLSMCLALIDLFFKPLGL